MEGDIKTMRDSIDADFNMYLKDLITDDKDRELLLAKKPSLSSITH